MWLGKGLIPGKPLQAVPENSLLLGLGVGQPATRGDKFTGKEDSSNLEAIHFSN
jgi:hypothetical protein